MYILENPNSVAIGTTTSINVVASSGLPLTIISATPDVCTVNTSGTIVDILAISVGTCTIIATQTGDEVTEPIEQVVKDFDVVKIPQKITFINPGVINLVGMKSVRFPLTLKDDYSTSTPTVISDTPLVCSVYGTTGTAIITGTCRLTATLDENATHSAATPVSVEFDIRGTEPGEKLISVVVPQSQIVAGTITNQYAIK